MRKQNDRVNTTREVNLSWSVGESFGDAELGEVTGADVYGKKMPAWSISRGVLTLKATRKADDTYASGKIIAALDERYERI